MFHRVLILISFPYLCISKSLILYVGRNVNNAYLYKKITTFVLVKVLLDCTGLNHSIRVSQLSGSRKYLRSIFFFLNKISQSKSACFDNFNVCDQCIPYSVNEPEIYIVYLLWKRLSKIQNADYKLENFKFYF